MMDDNAQYSTQADSPPGDELIGNVDDNGKADFPVDVVEMEAPDPSKEYEEDDDEVEVVGVVEAPQQATSFDERMAALEGQDEDEDDDDEDDEADNAAAGDDEPYQPVTAGRVPSPAAEYEAFSQRLVDTAAKHWSDMEVGKLVGLVASTMRWHRDRRQLVDFIRGADVRAISPDFIRGVNMRAAWLQGYEVLSLAYDWSETGPQFAQMVLHLVREGVLGLLDPGAVDLLVKAVYHKQGLDADQRLGLLRDVVEAAPQRAEKRALVLAVVRNMTENDPTSKDKFLQMVPCASEFMEDITTQGQPITVGDSDDEDDNLLRKSTPRVSGGKVGPEPTPTQETARASGAVVGEEDSLRGDLMGVDELQASEPSNFDVSLPGDDGDVAAAFGTAPFVDGSAEPAAKRVRIGDSLSSFNDGSLTSTKSESISGFLA